MIINIFLVLQLYNLIDNSLCTQDVFFENFNHIPISLSSSNSSSQSHHKIHHRRFRQLLKRKIKTRERIYCPELNVNFTNEAPFDILGNPVCGDKMTHALYLYLPTGITCEIVPSYLPNDKTSKCLEILKSTSNVFKLVFVIHGFLNQLETPWLRQFQIDIMDNDPGTAVILIGWGDGLWDIFHYWSAAANVRYISYAMYLVVKELRRVKDYYLHCIGHSLGGQACGLLGKVLKTDKHQRPLDRISGMDPAGPLFCNDVPYPFNYLNVSRESRLGPKDADFVDVIHTDGIARYLGIIPQYGTMEKLGTVDFYPGSSGYYGHDQPGCREVINIVSCSHGRAHKYYGSAISQAICFASKNCTGNTLSIPEDCVPIFGDQVTMGYWTNTQKLSFGQYTVETTGNDPYCA